MNKLLLSSYLAITFLLSACGGSSDDGKPAPEPIPAPVISSFTTSTSSIMAGEAEFLTAVFSNGNGTIDTSVGSINSGESKAVLPNNTTTYTLTVENSAGVKVSSSVTIKTVPLIITNIRPSSTDDELSFWLTVSSQLDIVEVVAEIADRSTVLNIYNPQENIYYGRISVANLTDGEYPLTITGKDKLGRTNSIIQQITIDKLPVINVITPVDQSFSTPLLPLDITCVDISDCQITVKNTDDDTVYSTATNDLNATIDLSPYQGHKVSLTIEGKTTSEQVTTNIVEVFVTEDNVTITPVKTFTGDILDFDGQRALIKDIHTENGTEHHQLHITDITTNNIDIIEIPSGKILRENEASLSDNGASFRTNSLQSYQWYKGKTFSFGKSNGIAAAGDYVAYCDNDTLYRTTLSSDITLALKPAGKCDHAIAHNGNVMTAGNQNNRVGLSLYNGINETPIHESWAILPKSNGNMFVYVTVPSNSANRYGIALYDGKSEIFASNPSNFFPQDTNNFYYNKNYFKLNSGWITYLDNPDGLGHDYWSRSPEGAIVQRTHFRDNSYLEALAKNGEAIFVYKDIRYLSKVDGEMVSFGAYFGKMYSINNNWYITNGNVLYELIIEQ